MATNHQSRVNGHPSKLRAGLSVPWSAYDELWARRALLFDSFAFISFGLGSLVALVFWFLPALAICASVTFFWGWMVHHDAMKLNAMLVNKPRSVGSDGKGAGLTEWVRVRPWQTEMCCACGACVNLSSAEWFPNPVDPGGGRYSIVCACGIGYYRLKETVARVP
jgi:hypothetical protein